MWRILTKTKNRNYLRHTIILLAVTYTFEDTTVMGTMLDLIQEAVQDWGEEEDNKRISSLFF